MTDCGKGDAPAPVAREDSRVAVAVPVYRDSLSDDEQISVRHLQRFLGEYPIYVFEPEGLDCPLRGYREIRFPARFFRSVDTYSRLLLSEDFYRRFEHYEYLLIYQLDCLVFSDRLADWCDRGLDYLGAPWLVDPARPARGFSRVGNGGLSLRRVSSCLEVLTSRRPPMTPLELLAARIPDLGSVLAVSRWYKRAQVLRQVRRGVRWYAGHYTLNEDHFWSDRAGLFEPGFTVAHPRQALAFAFERAPRYCYERNQRRLPFGCHGWWRWDREFWEPHLLSADSVSDR